MKKYLFSAIIISCLMVGCQKEDHIRPIFGDTTAPTEETLNNQCAIAGDTLAVTQVIKRHEAGWENLDRYDIYLSDSSKITLRNIFYTPEGITDTVSNLNDNNIVGYLTTDNHTTNFTFTLITSHRGNAYHLDLRGTLPDGETLHACYHDTLIDLNQPNGQGILVIGNDSSNISQLAYNERDHRYCYALLNPTDITTLAGPKVHIQRDSPITSGTFSIASPENGFHIAIVIGSGDDATIMPVTSGHITISCHNGYHIIIDGTCEKGNVSIHYESDQCLDYTQLPADARLTISYIL